MNARLARLYTWLHGFALSKTMTFAVMLAVLGAVQMYVNVLRPVFHSQQAYGWFCLILAIIVAVLRAITSQSLWQKGFSAQLNISANNNTGSGPAVPPLPPSG